MGSLDSPILPAGAGNGRTRHDHLRRLDRQALHLELVSGSGEPDFFTRADRAIEKARGLPYFVAVVGKGSGFGKLASQG